MPAHVIPSEHVRMIEMLRNLQKGQDEHKRQLDEILSKKRNFSEFSADNCSEEDVEAAFESAFRLLKKYKNTNSGSAQNPEKKIRKIAQKYSDELHYLFLPTPPTPFIHQPPTPHVSHPDL